MTTLTLHGELSDTDGDLDVTILDGLVHGHCELFEIIFNDTPMTIMHIISSGENYRVPDEILREMLDAGDLETVRFN